MSAALIVVVLTASIGSKHATAQTATVIDSVRVKHHQSDYEYESFPYFNCGSIVWATFPDVSPENTTYTYSLVSDNPDDGPWLVGAQGNYYPAPRPELRIAFAENEKAVYIGSTGTQAGGSYSSSCAYYATVYADVRASFGRWHAVYSIADGTPAPQWRRRKHNASEQRAQFLLP